MARISVVINTLNEEKNLPHAIASVKNFADEIIVVDMHSTDGTLEIAKREGAKVYLHEPTGYVEPARNFAIRKATGDWIFILDADEELSGNLVKNLKKIVDKPKADYFRISRKNIIFGKWMKHSRWWPDYNIRFFKKGSVSWNEIIHTVPITMGEGKDLQAKEDFSILHHHYDSVEQFIERMNRYTTQHAKILIGDGYTFSWKDLIIKPTNEFLSRYFFGEGYKDGLHGLAVSLLQWVSEFVMYLKVWQREKFKEEEPNLANVIATMKKAEKDLHYWQADAMVKAGGGILHRVRRKFKI